MDDNFISTIQPGICFHTSHVPRAAAHVVLKVSAYRRHTQTHKTRVFLVLSWTLIFFRYILGRGGGLLNHLTAMISSAPVAAGKKKFGKITGRQIVCSWRDKLRTHLSCVLQGGAGGTGGKGNMGGQGGQGGSFIMRMAGQTEYEIDDINGQLHFRFHRGVDPKNSFIVHKLAGEVTAEKERSTAEQQVPVAT